MSSIDKYVYQCYNNSDKLFCISDEKNKEIKILKSLISMGYIRIYYDNFTTPIINTPKEYNSLNKDNIIDKYPTINNLFSYILKNQKILDIINYVRNNINDFLYTHICENNNKNYIIIIVDINLQHIIIYNY